MAQPDKMITPLVNKEPRDTFLFTPQLSNNVGAPINKYAVPQQNEFSLDPGLSLELQRPPLVFHRNSAS